jgi:hypothetical protein
MNESMGNMRDKWIRIKGDVSNSHPYRGIMITP